MKKKLTVVVVVLGMVALVAYSKNKTVSTPSKDLNYVSSDNNESDKEEASSSLPSSSFSSNSSRKTVEHYCEADGCYKEGIISVTGFSGEPEYYCQDHYDEMLDIIGKMEQDVGNGEYSKHQCEECSKEGTHELIGLSGQTEYYCTEHYNELIDLINELYEK